MTGDRTQAHEASLQIVIIIANKFGYLQVMGQSF